MAGWLELNKNMIKKGFSTVPKNLEKQTVLL
jgi:hypothetical protein